MQGYPLFNRISKVNYVAVYNVTEASLFQVGDSTYISERGRAISLLRSYPIYNGNEVFFKQYSAFNTPIPTPTFEISTFPKMYYPKSNIYVNSVRIISVAGNAVFHIGSTHSVFLEAKLQQIRNVIHKPKEEFAFAKFNEPILEYDCYNIDTEPLDPRF